MFKCTIPGLSRGVRLRDQGGQRLRGTASFKYTIPGLYREVRLRDQGGQRLRRADSNILYLGCPEEWGSETKEGRGCVEQVQIYCTWDDQGGVQAA